MKSLLPVPQFLANLKNKTTEGLSTFLILCWFAGDSFKTWYYISNSQPMQFILCGFLQLIFDSLILLQIQAY